MFENSINKKINKKIVCLSIVVTMVMSSFVVPEMVMATTQTSTQSVPVVQKPIYTVYFNGNKGKVSTKSKRVQYTNIYGSLPTPKRSKYTFKGWYTKKKADQR